MKRVNKMVLALLISCLAWSVQAAEKSTLADFDGNPRSIESYAGDGKWLVVMFWAHNCHICNQEAESYAQFHIAHKDTDASVLGVSIDGDEHRAEAEAFISRHDLPFPNLIGEPVATMLRFMSLTQEQFRGTPSILLFGPDGTLKAAQAGAVPTSSIESFIKRNSAQAAAAAGG